MQLTRVLKQGMSGPDVGAVQAGLFITTDEQFGPETAAAVIDYQGSHKLPVTGFVDQQTMDSILAARPLPSAKLDALGRFIRFAGEGKYVLGAGGTNPRQATPFTWRGAQYGSDCIGAVMWAVGCPRHHDAFDEYEGDINVDSALMNAGLAGLGGKGSKTFFSPLDGPMHPGVIVCFRSVWEKDIPGSTAPPSGLVRMGHVGMVAGWTGLTDPAHPEATPWDHQTSSLVTMECCYRIPACRLGHNVNFIDGKTVRGVTNADWGIQFLTFNGPVET